MSVISNIIAFEIYLEYILSSSVISFFINQTFILYFYLKKFTLNFILLYKIKNSFKFFKKNLNFF